jgi:hypothetical protein
MEYELVLPHIDLDQCREALQRGSAPSLGLASRWEISDDQKASHFSRWLATGSRGIAAAPKLTMGDMNII